MKIALFADHNFGNIDVMKRYFKTFSKDITIIYVRAGYLAEQVSTMCKALDIKVRVMTPKFDKYKSEAITLRDDEMALKADYIVNFSKGKDKGNKEIMKRIKGYRKKIITRGY
jgi:hypothetical protein